MQWSAAPGTPGGANVTLRVGGVRCQWIRRLARRAAAAILSGMPDAIRRRNLMVGAAVLVFALASWGIAEMARPPAWPARAQPGDITPSPPAGGVNRLTVTFWNVDWFPGQRPNASELKRRAHVAAVAPVLERLDPDILGLEEVADRSAAQLLADHLKGFKVDVCSEFLRGDQPSGQQEVLCSRLPLIAGSWERWKPGADGVQPRRGFAFAAYRLPAGGIALVYGLHLKSNRVDDSAGPQANTAEREEASRQLLAQQRAMAAVYGRQGTVVLTIVAGDMNTSLDDPRFAAETTLRDLLGPGGFAWAWAGIPAGARLTLPAEGRYPAVCFDHIFYRANGVRLESCAMEPTGRTASDHRPVTAVFGW
jgi:endonuclease/exonuclease/phosphatase family metal-dependent hydrolase